MKKSTKTLIIIGSILLTIGLILGFIALAEADFDFAALTERRDYTQKTVEVELQPEDKVVISLETDDVRVGLSEDEKAHLTYYDSKNDEHVFSYEDGELSLKRDFSTKKWYEYIVFNFDWSDRTVELLLPADFKGQVLISCTTGNIGLDAMTLYSDLSVDTTTGNVDVKNSEADKLSISTTTGHVKLEETKAGRIDLCTTTGGISLIRTDSEWLNIEATTGNIKLDGVIGDIINISATTGNVKGSLAAKQSDYSISANTTTGNCNLASSHGGARTLTVNTTTGNIKITFEK